jgi:DNA-binding protein YbaB
MKFSFMITTTTTTALLLSASGSSSAFMVQLQPQTQTRFTALHLFGSGEKSGNKQPGMMDQLAMFKKAQEVATKKKGIDMELQQMDFVGVGGDGDGVTVAMKYMPTSNPMDPNPEYEAIRIEFKEEFFQSSAPEVIAEGVTSAIANGIEEVNKAVTEKYAALQSDLMAALGQKS